MTFRTARPVMLNGIGDVIERSDLVDRCVFVQLEPIPDSGRRLEREFWSEFERARPAILGAVLDAVSCAIRRRGVVELPARPRMADFAEWVTAAEPALGLAEGAFLTAYLANRRHAHAMALEADPLAAQLVALVDDVDRWEGSASELLEVLTRRAGPAITRRATWP